MDPVTAAIRQLRKQLDVSQTEFAKRVGLSLRAVASYESGDRKPPPKTLVSFMKLADSGRYTELATVFQCAVELSIGYSIKRYRQLETIGQSGAIEINPIEWIPAV